MTQSGTDDAMTHVAVADKQDASAVTWREQASDADYQAALVSAGLAPSRSEGTFRELTMLPIVFHCGGNVQIADLVSRLLAEKKLD